MNYEQRYKEALDEAKAIHKIIKKDLKPIIEQIFPELKESEHEKIRKELIDYIKKKSENSCSPTPPKNTLINWITWLEKQTEIESMTSWKPTEKQINAIKLARSFVTDDFGSNPTLSETLKGLEKQLENLI